jgi:multidrug resistance efflux pump
MRLIKKYALPLAAVAMLVFAIIQVVRAQQTKPKAEPPVQPARMPYGNGVAGAGLVEPQTENISVGSYVPGIVTKVHVKVGDKVRADSVLFELDDRPLKAELLVRQANLESAQAQLSKLRQQPRPEEVPPLVAKKNESEANLADQQDQLQRTEAIYSGKAIGEEELFRRRQAVSMARQQLEQADANLKLLRAGAWEPDITLAKAALDQARGQLAQTETDLKRLKVTALMPANVTEMEVLQVNVRPGEYVGAPPGQALIVLGHVNQLHIRVDIDEHDIPRFNRDGAAVARLRGDPRITYPLRFVRIEPYVIPKKSLTGDNTERVDTRVLQVIYAVDAPPGKLFVGQQMDVFIASE